MAAEWVGRGAPAAAAAHLATPSTSTSHAGCCLLAPRSLSLSLSLWIECKGTVRANTSSQCLCVQAGSGWAKPCLWTAAGGVLMVTLLTAAAAAMGLVALQGAASTVKLRVGGHALTLSLSREAPTSASGSRGRIWGAAGSTRGLPCRASGYCSLGRSKVWRGDVATNRALQAMLKAVTYKKEVGRCVGGAEWVAGWCQRGCRSSSYLQAASAWPAGGRCPGARPPVLPAVCARPCTGGGPRQTCCLVPPCLCRSSSS